MRYVHVDKIDFDACEVLREGKLFVDSEGKHYKVWPENTIVWSRDLGATLMMAIASGFYDGIAHIDAVIMSDNGRCVGYVTNTLRCLKENDPDIKYEKNKHGLNSLSALGLQDDKYRRFLQRIKDNVKRTGFFFYDLVQLNIADVDGEFVLIDLESVLHIRNLYRIPPYHRQCMPLDYLAFLEKHYSEVVDHTNSGINMELVTDAWGMSTGGMDRKPYYEVDVNGHRFAGERPWRHRWIPIKSAMDWRGKRILDLGTCMGMVPTYLIKHCGAESATAVDFNQYLLDASDTVRKAFRLSKERIRFLKVDMDGPGYEETLGYDYDVVFCLSFLRWIKDQDRLLRFLSRIPHVIMEPHDIDQDIIAKMYKVGHTAHKQLGKSAVGHSFPNNIRRLYHFWKED